MGSRRLLHWRLDFGRSTFKRKCWLGNFTWTYQCIWKPRHPQIHWQHCAHLFHRHWQHRHFCQNRHHSCICWSGFYSLHRLNADNFIFKGGHWPLFDVQGSPSITTNSTPPKSTHLLQNRTAIWEYDTTLIDTFANSSSAHLGHSSKGSQRKYLQNTGGDEIHTQNRIQRRRRISTWRCETYECGLGGYAKWASTYVGIL